MSASRPVASELWYCNQTSRPATFLDTPTRAREGDQRSAPAEPGSRGCFEQFYRSRCAVCERDLSRDPTTGEARSIRRRFCGRKCNGGYKRFPHVYSVEWPKPSSSPTDRQVDSRSADSTGIKTRLRVVAREGDQRSAPAEPGSRGCFEQFYRSRCAVCERDLSRDPTTAEKRSTRRRFCGRKCNGEYRRFPHVFDVAPRKPVGEFCSQTLSPPTGRQVDSRSAHSTGIKTRLRVVRGSVEHRIGPSDVPVNILGGGYRWPSAIRIGTALETILRCEVCELSDVTPEAEAA
jgi:hypothetical protein